MKRVISATVFGLALALPALAQDFQGPFRLPTFEELDKNKDGKISRDEFPGPPQFFDRLDLNGDGFISKDEFDEIQRRFGAGQRQGQGQLLGRLFERLLDTNRDGKISREEWARIVDLFDRLDADHDGFIIAEELAALPQLAPPAQRAANAPPGGINIDQIFAQYDTNKDGKLSAEELKSRPQLMALDADKDGFVTREEIEKFVKSRQSATPRTLAPAPSAEPKKP